MSPAAYVSRLLNCSMLWAKPPVSMWRVSIGLSPGAFSSHQRIAIGYAFREDKPL
jgi:hypothetical protein